jgi:poly(3-hydroxybutyrate) depolymerase
MKYLVAAAIALAASIASADPKPPCRDCTLDVPHMWWPVPLLVVLHGNGEDAADAAARWREIALARGWALLSLDCPRDLGCDDKWYEWNGEPDWVRKQVLAVMKEVRIDPRRVYLAGWSGGATYIGMHAPAWARTFAGVVIHGGGVAPKTDACPDRLPVYFLVGDQNPAHQGSVDLRDYFRRCNQDVTWDLLRGAAHPDEKAALTAAKGRTILAWLEQRHGTRTARIMSP